MSKLFAKTALLLTFVGLAFAAVPEASAYSGSCNVNVNCTITETETHVTTTTQTCTQAFNIQINVFGENTMKCVNSAKDVGNDGDRSA